MKYEQLAFDFSLPPVEDTGFLVPPDFAEEMTRKICMLFDVPLCLIGECADDCEACTRARYNAKHWRWQDESRRDALRRHFRWWRDEKREQFAQWAYEILSGARFPESDYW